MTRITLPAVKAGERAFRSFSKREHAIFIGLFILLVISTVGLLSRANQALSVQVPTEGGSISEGIVGTPRFVNPVLAFSDADRDLTALVYSGLMRKTENGTVIPDLAESYTISDDGLVYTFVIRNNATFHDGKKVTADDVLLTISRIQDPLLKSPKRISWEGITARVVDERTISFTLKQPYEPFLAQATVGILPAHLWQDVGVDEFTFSDYNIDAVGSGPYKINKIKRKSTGSPDMYELNRFKRFALGKPYIKTLTFHFYANERELLRAFEANDFEQMSAITPEKALFYSENKYKLEKTVLPRAFGLFFNQNESPIFTDKNVIRAFNKAINKERIIKEVLYGYGTALSGPIPTDPQSQIIERADTDAARTLLENNGWKANADGILEKKFGKETRQLAFSISTGDVPELRYAAQLIKEDLEKLGATVEIKVFEVTQLNQNVIRPRKYEALFFGQIISSSADLYAFWHSSQRNDPGLNIALYTNTKIDSILEDLVRTTDPAKYNQLLGNFSQEISKDAPAVFVYAPEFIYLIDSDLKGFSLGEITIPSDRFQQVYKWHTETDSVWKIFYKPKQNN